MHSKRTSNHYPNPKPGILCRARPDARRRNLSVKMKMPEGRSEAAQMYEEGINEAEHDQMLRAAEAEQSDEE